MSEALKAALEEAETALATKMSEVKRIRITINGLCSLMGEPPRYAEDEPEQPRVVRSAKLKPDHFFKKTPVTAIREYLELADAPKSQDEILRALEEGGFHFEDQGWADDAGRLRNLAITLAKNSSVFSRIPNGHWGLAKWYGETPPKKPKVKLVSKASNGTGVSEVPAPADADAEVEDTSSSPPSETQEPTA